ncbi:MAG TPA: hypothetical protein VKB50_06920 [Vicinamibacterales bacterium]|nr:hypothetical protein [Vicinamibacterales bacterium]
MRTIIVTALASILVVLIASVLFFPAGDSPGVDLPPTIGPSDQPKTVPPTSTPETGTRSGGTGFGRGGRGDPPDPAPIADRFAEIDEALGRLVTGQVAFNSPDRMRLGETRTVALVASPEMDASTLSSELRQRIGGTDPIAVDTLQIAPVMEAQLEGASAFAITALTPLRQPVSRAPPTEWRWSVRANETGTHPLHLTINAIITVAGEPYQRSIDVLDRSIRVEISSSQRIGMFLETNWQWLLGTIAIPLGVWLWSERTKKGRKPRRRR